MANDNPNPLLAYAEARLAAWSAVVSSLKTALALDPGGQTIEGLDLSSSVQGGDLGQPIDLPHGAFLGKSIPACVKIYLSAAKRKKTTKEIATALKEGGVETVADNFESTVYTALLRLKTAGDVLKFKDGWGLSEWVPANLRARVPTVANRGSKKKSRNRKPKTKALLGVTTAAIKAETPKVTEIGGPVGAPEPRILDFLKSHQHEVLPIEVASALDLKIQTTHLVLAKLAHQRKIEKLATGHYKALSAAS